MWLGRFQLGDRVPLVLQSTSNSGVAATPTAATVTAKIYDSGGSLVTTINLGINNIAQSLGLLKNYWMPTAVGRYMVVFDWTATTALKEVACFEVVAGGSSTGPVIAMHATELPEATYVLLQGGNGTVYYARNPY